MKETLTLTFKLLLICAVITALLAWVNVMTEPIIAQNEQSSFQAAMTEVLPDAGMFTKKEISNFVPSETGVTINSVYEAERGGAVVSAVSSEGYGGDISIMVGITEDGKVNQIKVMSMSETPGLGAKSTEPEFAQKYVGLEKGISVIKNSQPEGNEIIAISGATVTSKAVTKAVNGALEAAEFISQKGGK
ncbi:MAG: RnfABCDGE type electron transport complex subunit G [Clostridia bacterium]|nr:RnfABCDGE type electron transport complex subunit G [Clostridia bacterium]